MKLDDKQKAVIRWLDENRETFIFNREDIEAANDLTSGEYNSLFSRLGKAESVTFASTEFDKFSGVYLGPTFDELLVNLDDEDWPDKKAEPAKSGIKAKLFQYWWVPPLGVVMVFIIFLSDFLDGLESLYNRAADAAASWYRKE